MSGSSQNWSIPTNAVEHFRQTDKRLGWEERRPRITKAADLMGPGLGPFAVTIDSLDGETAAFNGMWYIPAGIPGSPDPAKNLIGFTIADSEHGGTQYVMEFEGADAPFSHYMRGFEYAITGGTRFYSDWEEVGGSPPAPTTTPIVQIGSTSITPSAANTWTSKVITFDEEFATVPNVSANVESTSTVTMNTRASTASVTGCTLWLYAGNTTARTVSYIAAVPYSAPV